MSHTESDRKAFNDYQAEQKEKEAIAKWLNENPHIGVLNSGKFYKIVNNEKVLVAKFYK